jgi:hypothetical protein
MSDATFRGLFVPGPFFLCTFVPTFQFAALWANLNRTSSGAAASGSVGASRSLAEANIRMLNAQQILMRWYACVFRSGTDKAPLNRHERVKKPEARR